MMEEKNAVTEEYLEAIYRLQSRMGVAKTGELVSLLGVVPGTVTNTIERLEREDLVTHVPYKGVRLTERGVKIAVDVLRRHRLSERLLTDVLHVSWDKAHKIACRLEHDITGDIVRNVERVLGYPKTCPHGNPIPTEHGSIDEEETQSISELAPQGKGIVSRILDEDPELLRKLSILGLKPGVAIEVLKKSPSEGEVSVRIGERMCTIDDKTAASVQVQRTENARNVQPLVSLKDGESGIITSALVIGKGQGYMKRLMDMGLTPGTKVKVVNSAPLGGPVELQVRGSRLALGRGIAQKILVEMI
jgi:DtxR family Mn-dependent transcriptional regulator